VPFLVAGAPLVATMPARIAHFFAATLKLTISPAPVELPEAVASLVWHASYDHDPANTWLRHTVESIAGNAGWRKK
jgi:LysR family transcriptional regulator, mexEF-oprN operon transcriptional activator